jgi:transcriptional regulator with XRE-family HTH domain
MRALPQLIANLRILRERHGLTQESAAEAAGFEYKYFQKVESGRKPNLRLDTLERLARAFGLEVWELLGPELPEKTRLAPRARIRRRAGR